MSFAIPQQRLGVLMVVSGPSGTGKTTLCRKLCDEGEAVFSVSCTTRAPRPGEVDGKDYFFLSDADFVARIEGGEFFEHAHVHGRRYGTLKSCVTDNLKRGIDVLMDIDVQGVASCRKADLDVGAYIFVAPPSIKELESRLKGRGTETEDKILEILAADRNALSIMRLSMVNRGWRETVENNLQIWHTLYRYWRGPIVPSEVSKTGLQDARRMVRLNPTTPRSLPNFRHKSPSIS
jgi:guanylate kinase